MTKRALCHREFQMCRETLAGGNYRQDEITNSGSQT